MNFFFPALYQMKLIESAKLSSDQQQQEQHEDDREEREHLHLDLGETRASTDLSDDDVCWFAGLQFLTDCMKESAKAIQSEKDYAVSIEASRYWKRRPRYIYGNEGNVRQQSEVVKDVFEVKEITRFHKVDQQQSFQRRACSTEVEEEELGRILQSRSDGWYHAKRFLLSSIEVNVLTNLFVR
tara:strand:+ start:5231 stop:5779 length:549 start_codon:yes stop_codon:yes gene_type:complete